MTDKATRGKAWTKAEDDVIRLALKQGMSYRKIGALMGRGKSSVGLRIKAMQADQTIGQSVLDMGRANG